MLGNLEQGFLAVKLFLQPGALSGRFLRHGIREKALCVAIPTQVMLLAQVAIESCSPSRVRGVHSRPDAEPP